MAPSVYLEWPGKRAPILPDRPTVLENVQPPRANSSKVPQNRLIQGDNLAVMSALMPPLAGKVSLIYLDPPFFTGRNWHMQTPAGSGPADRAYEDMWDNDLSIYLQWLLDALAAARHLPSESGSIYVHLNWQAAHYAKLLMDELFGMENFQNEIIWCYREGINSKSRWNRKHDTILFYSKTDEFAFNSATVLQPYLESTVSKFRHRDTKGPYRLMGRGIVDSALRSKRDLAPEMETLFPELTYRHYLGEGTLPVDYWLIDIENQASSRRTGYPTQKPEELLVRILLASTDAGDLVADFCCGSGTTLAVAQKLGRAWIGCDVGNKAIEVSRRRLEGLGAKFDLQRVAD